MTTPDAVDGQRLLAAATTGDEAEARALLAGGADVRVTGNHGYTPLHLASARGHPAIVEALLTAGAGVNAKSDSGWTPLHWASDKGHVAVVEALLAGGADVDAKSNGGGTPLHEASARCWDHAVVVELLLAGGCASRNGHVAVVEPLLAWGADIYAKDRAGKTPRDIAARFGRAAVVEVLLAEHKKNVTTLLELGLWKAKMDESDGARPEIRKQCRDKWPFL